MFWLGLVIGLVAGVALGVAIVLYGAEIFLLSYRFQRWRERRK